MLPLSLYQMMFQGQRPGPPTQPFPDRPPAAPVSPAQRWFDMISRPSSDPNAPATRPSNPYEALLNMTTNAGLQGPAQQPPQSAQQPNPAGIPDWMRMLGGAPQQQPVAPGQTVQQGPAAYRDPRAGLNIAQMGLGMLQPRGPYG